MPVLISPTAFHRLVVPGRRAGHRPGRGRRRHHHDREHGRPPSRSGRSPTRPAPPRPTTSRPCGSSSTSSPTSRITEALVRRATEAGCTALVVTVDSPVLGRERAQPAQRLPRSAARHVLREPAQICAAASRATCGRSRCRPSSPGTTSTGCAAYTACRSLLKGVLHPDDARLAVAHGVDGLMVSNHGGRQLDTVPATSDAAARDSSRRSAARVPVLLDGGVRRGTDVRQGAGARRRRRGRRPARRVGAGRGRRAGRRAGAGAAARGTRPHRSRCAARRSLADLTPDLVVRCRGRPVVSAAGVGLESAVGSPPCAASLSLPYWLPRVVVALRVRIFAWVNGDEGIAVPGRLVGQRRVQARCTRTRRPNGRSRGAALSDLFWYWLAPGPEVHQEHLEPGPRYDDVARTTRRILAGLRKRRLGASSSAAAPAGSSTGSPPARPADRAGPRGAAAGPDDAGLGRGLLRAGLRRAVPAPTPGT